MKHILKIWPQYYQAVADGSKTFEVRVNDRGFQKGDHVLLREFDPRIVTVVGDFGHSYEEERGFTGAKDLEFKIGTTW